MSRKLLLIVLSFVVVTTVALVIGLLSGGQDGDVHKIKKGKLISSLNCVGEIEAKKAIVINMPEELRDWSLRVYEYKIIDMVKDGKIVKKGDYLLKLDEEELRNNMMNRMRDKEKTDADLKNAVIDSTVKLTAIREEIIDLKMDLEYEKIDLDQSKYGSAAEQRKAQMNYHKAEINLEKKRRSFVLEQNKLKIQISRHESRSKELDQQLKKYQDAIEATKIESPENGLMMFEKDHFGKTYTKDSKIPMYRRAPIATLPNMSSVVSEAYVKEIDVTKLSVNDSVQISVDALPNKEFTGKIIKIANMGEEHKNFDMKVFKIKVELDFSDSELKPGMTTNNTIILKNIEDGLLVPLNGVYSENDVTFVYKKEGKSFNRQIVKIGAEDNENAVVLYGLKEGDKIMLNPPDEMMVTGSL